MPINQDISDSIGIDRAAVDALHRRVKTARGVQRYVITAAQNATPINQPFFESLKSYCRHNGAELIVIPYRYKNPTSMWSEKAMDDDWWASGLAPYLLDRRVTLNRHLVLLADIKTQPTASEPLSGFETVTAGLSAIIGHPKVQLKTVPTPQSRMAKILVTTGAVTKRNYIPSKAGKKAEHHHTFGACAVEISAGKFFIRQINAVRDGSFIDLDTKYDGAKITRAGRALALAMGDSHKEFIDAGVVKATFGKGGIIEALKPKALIWHDAHDFYSRNHHHRGEVFINLVKHRERRDNVAHWLRDTFKFVDDVAGRDIHNYFVPSNHPDAIARWIKETDPRTDPENCVFWAETFKAMAEGSKWTYAGAVTIDPFAYWGRKWLKPTTKATFLERGESLTIADIEFGYHADKGVGGKPGTIKMFARLGVKTVTGHGHSPAIYEGHHRLGTSSILDMEYVRGTPSSWLHAHDVLYENGKRSLLFIIDGDWRAPPARRRARKGRR